MVRKGPETGFSQTRVRSRDEENGIQKLWKIEFVVFTLVVSNTPGIFVTLISEVLTGLIDIVCVVYMK